MRLIARAAMALVFVGVAFAQTPSAQPAVIVAPVGAVTVQIGKSATVDMAFRVASGFHINSNKPSSELLIPTAVKLDPPTDILIGKITYPAGELVAFPFSPDEKLSVYSGDFNVSALVRASHSISPGTYRVRGQLKYQACDNRACFPPKTTPVDFDVKVVKAARAGRRNPAQSPHVHK